MRYNAARAGHIGPRDVTVRATAVDTSRAGPSRSQLDAMATERCYGAMLKNVMAANKWRCYEAMLKNAMAMERCYDAMLCSDAKDTMAILITKRSSRTRWR